MEVEKKTVEEIGLLHEKIEFLEVSMLEHYIAHVLSERDFYPVWILDASRDSSSDIEIDSYFSTKDDWVEHIMNGPITQYDWSDEIDFFETRARELDRGAIGIWWTLNDLWDIEFASKDSKGLRVTIINDIWGKRAYSSSKPSPPPDLYYKIYEESAQKGNEQFFVVSPNVKEEKRSKFKEFKQKISKLMADDIFVTPEEFIYRNFPDDEEKREEIKDNWKEIREKTIADLQEEWPFIALVEHNKNLSKAKKLLEEAEAHYIQKEYETSISKIGKTCEHLLKVLYPIAGNPKVKDKLTYNDLLTSSRNYIFEGLGKDVYKDLEFVRNWRNKVAHAHTEEINKNTALEVLRRGEMIYELLNELVFSAS